MKKTLLLTMVTGILLSGCGTAPEQPAQTTTTPAATPSQVAAATPPPGGGGGGDATKGKAVFEGTCVACHGQDGHGIMNLGKSLVGSKMLELNDKDLVTFVTKGRDTSDPANTTGVAMPPKGGNPALTEKDLFDVVAYIRTLK